MEGEMEGVPLLIVLVVVSVTIYLLPSWIASSRNHHQKWAIFALNLLLGWTFVGWVIAFVWALTAVNEALQRK